jgi:hypothetical protein
MSGKKEKALVRVLRLQTLSQHVAIHGSRRKMKMNEKEEGWHRNYCSPASSSSDPSLCSRRSPAPAPPAPIPVAVVTGFKPANRRYERNALWVCGLLRKAQASDVDGLRWRGCPSECSASHAPLSEPNVIAVLSEWRVEPGVRGGGALGKGGIVLARGGHGTVGLGQHIGYTEGLRNLDVGIVGATDSLTGDVMLWSC